MLIPPMWVGGGGLSREGGLISEITVFGTSSHVLHIRVVKMFILSDSKVHIWGNTTSIHVYS